MIEGNCTNIRILEMTGFLDINLNPMDGILTQRIITSARPEKLKTFTNLGFSQLSSLFFPENNEGILKAQSAEWQICRKNPNINAGFPENLAFIFRLPDLKSHYTFSIQPLNEEFKEKSCKNLTVNTGNREENC